MRLRDVLPTLKVSPTNEDRLTELVNAFDELQLLTPEDVVLRSSEQDLIEKLPPNVIDKKNISILFQEILDLVTAIPHRGDVLHTHEQGLATGLGKCLSTGVSAIDRLLRFPDFGIIELAGPPATGKTVLSGKKIRPFHPADHTL